VTDLHSRFILKIDALEEARTSFARRRSALFRRQGIPEIIRVDNGAPFASQGPGGLSKLSVWWIGLGIEVQFSRPACPQDNGCHERMHRTMKAECCDRRASTATRGKTALRPLAQGQRATAARGAGNAAAADAYHASAMRTSASKPRLYPLGAGIRQVDAADSSDWRQQGLCRRGVHRCGRGRKSEPAA
jgi:transposase InsO family protein